MHQDDGPTYKQAIECSTKFGPLTKKGKLKWNKRLFVLKGAELLYFDAEADLNPKLTIDLGSGSIDLSELGSCKQGFYCFNLKDQNGRTHVMCTEKSKDQEAWIQALVDNGVKFIEDPVNTSLSQKSIFEFEVLDINKQPVNLSKFDGKVCLVVNVASFWGLTNQTYTEMQQLYEKYQPEGFEILGFPCNQFGNQEPGTNEEIVQFVKKFNVSFTLFDKIDVNGKNAAPLFTFLKAKLGGTLGASIKWNFTKFLCDRNGLPVKRFGPPSKPLSFENDIVEEIKKEQRNLSFRKNEETKQ